MHWHQGWSQTRDNFLNLSQGRSWSEGKVAEVYKLFSPVMRSSAFSLVEYDKDPYVNLGHFKRDNVNVGMFVNKGPAVDVQGGKGTIRFIDADGDVKSQRFNGELPAYSFGLIEFSRR
jgi:hypothetical protein